MIVRLPDHVIAQIAAGEVIERPCSILKELFENAIDASSASIEVSFREGGITYLQVKDNGIGMSQDDLNSCLLHHTTSKVQDLSCIQTFGFRGEALSSISSVARVRIQSRTEATSHGWEYNDFNTRPCAHEKGTTFTVTDLFYAIPARLNFLRSQTREREHCIKWFQRLSVMQPHITCVLREDQKELFRYQACSKEQRIFQVMEKSLPALSLQCETEYLQGYIAMPTYAGRQEPMLFLNHRFIKDKMIQSAIKKAYGDLLHRPATYILNLILDSKDYDVNVHPSKTEVRFRNPQHVYQMIVQSIQSTFEQQKKSTFISIPPPSSYEESHKYRPSSFVQSESSIPFQNSHLSQITTHQVIEPQGNVLIQKILSTPLCQVLTQLHCRYILATNEEGLVIIDQHALHERLVYEELKKKDVLSQNLTAPVIISITENEKNFLESQMDDLKLLGFQYTFFGLTLAIRAVPSLLHNVDIQNLIHEMLKTKDTEVFKEEIYKKLASLACHHSIRSGRRLSLEEMQTLIDQIDFTTSQCNHGRPTYIKWSIKFLDNLFER